MALLDYMGDAPGFMSYRRTPQRDLTKIPQRTAPEKKEFKDETFEFDAKGNPGDKQFNYNAQKEFNDGLKSLYNKYDGEMSWVTADPEYKDLVSNMKFAVYSQDAAEQNEVTTREREKQLNTPDSGHNASDIELMRDRDGSFVPVQGSVKDQKFMTKEEYLQYLITEPQVQQMPDGSFGIGYVDVDNGTGSEKDFNAFLDNIFTDGHVGLTRGASTVSKTENQQITEGLDYAVNYFQKQGTDESTNYQQLEDGVNYLVKYGMNDQQEYFLWQSFYKDAAEGREFKMPKVDENGQIVKDADQQMVTEGVYPTDEDLADPAKRKVMFNMYVQDRILDYSQKFKTRSVQTEYQERRGYRNFDPATGQPIVDQTLPWWTNVQSGQGPAGDGYVKDEEYPSSATQPYSENLSNDNERIQGKPVVYDRTNIASTHFDQMAETVNGLTVGQLSADGYVMVGKHRQPAGALKNLKISDLQQVRQIPSGKMVKDPQTGKMVPETTWAVRAVILADDDSDAFNNVKYWDAGTGNINQVTDVDWGFWDYNDATAKDRGFFFEESRDQAKDRKHYINGDEGTGYLDYGDANVKGIVVDIPISELTMIGADQKKLGQKQAVSVQNIMVDASQRATAEAHARNNAVNYGKNQGAVWTPKPKK